MIKEKIKSTWTWIKKQWVKGLIALGIIGVCAAAGLPLDTKAIPHITAPENNSFVMGERNYGASFNDDITSNNAMLYTLKDKYIGFKPIEMKWDTQFFKAPNMKYANVYDEELKENVNTLASKWDNIGKNKKKYVKAFGKGIDMEMELSDRIWSKIVKIDSLKSLGAIPKGVESLKIVFEVDTNMIIDGWNKKDDFEITETVRLGDFSYIQPAMVWDSNAKIQITSILSENNGKLYLTKKIPVSYLKTATYPVYTDLGIRYGVASKFDTAFGIYEINLTEINTRKYAMIYDRFGGPILIITTVDDNGTITYGSSTQFANDVEISSTNRIDICKLGTDKFVIVYSDDSDATDDTFAVVGTAVGTTTPTLGIPVKFEQGDVEWVSCEQLDTDKFVASYNDIDDSGTGKSTVMTVSGTVITTSTPTDFSTTDYDPQYIDIAQVNTDKYITCFESNDDADGYCVVASSTVSIIPSFGTVAKFTTNNPIYISVCSPDTDKFVLLYYDNNDSGFGKMIAGTISGETITYGAIKVFQGTGSSLNNRCTEISSDRAIFAYVDGGDGSDGKTISAEIDWDNKNITTSTAQEFSSQSTGGGSDFGLDMDNDNSNTALICYQNDGQSNDPGYCISAKNYGCAVPDPNNFTYYKEMTIENEYVATSTDNGYVILATTTDADLKTVTNGGKVSNDNGSDIVFYDDDQSTFLDFEIEKYTSTTGELVAWVNVPDISSTTNKTLYMYYGDSTTTVFECPKQVWSGTDIDPMGVWNLSHTPTVDSYAYDSTANNIDGTLVNLDLADQIAGQVDGSFNLDSGEYYTTDKAFDIQSATGVTISLWFNRSRVVNYEWLFCEQGTANNNNEVEVYLATGGIYAKAWEGTGAHGLVVANTTTGEFIHLVFTFDASAIKLYINGFEVASGAGSTPAATAGTWYYGTRPGVDYLFDGIIDNFRIYNKVLSQADITTIYNMEKDNASFLTWGSETATTTPVEDEETPDINNSQIIGYK